MERGKHRDQWQRLTQSRLEDAEVLLKNGRYDAAYYLAGYAVECALKARIVRVLEGYFPPKQNLYTHNLKLLLDGAELAEDIVEEVDPLIRGQWDIVTSWSEESRYNPQDQEAAEDMLKAVRGVIEWIKKYW